MVDVYDPRVFDLQCWLWDCGCTGVVPVWIEFGRDRVAFTGCVYDQERKAIPGARNRAPSMIHAMYMLGEYPKAWHKARCTWLCDNTTWYLAAYIQQDMITERVKQFHPFGASFMLMPDHYDVTLRKPIRKMRVTCFG